MFDNKNVPSTNGQGLSDVGQTRELNPLMNQNPAGSNLMDENKGVADFNQGKDFPFKKVENKKYPDTPEAVRAEDMFAGTETENKIQNNQFVPTQQNNLNNTQQIMQQKNSIGQSNMQNPTAMPFDQIQTNNKSGNKWLTVIIIFLVVIVLGLAGYWVYNIINSDATNNFDDLNNLEQENDINKILDNLQTQTQTQNEQKNIDNNLPAQEENVTEENASVQEEVVEQDSDQDGLSDSQERELGTNPARVDTDFDGLSDREEVEVYQTDPTSADSDRDGYLDGVEVNNGYNPLGPGKINELNNQIE